MLHKEQILFAIVLIRNLKYLQQNYNEFIVYLLFFYFIVVFKQHQELISN
tara:strand:- start:684 stop:833 length:150 start_codon:yes stop_codon:yes gene_type:complete